MFKGVEIAKERDCNRGRKEVRRETEMIKII